MRVRRNWTGMTIFSGASWILGLTVSLIPDGHVSPALFRVAHGCFPVEAIYYTTDAVAAAGAPPGRYTVGELEVEVGPDQIVRQPGQTNFAGSALRPVQGVFSAAQMLRCPWQQAWTAASVQPARSWAGPVHWRPANRPTSASSGPNQRTSSLNCASSRVAKRLRLRASVE